MHANFNELIANHSACCSNSNVASENGKRFVIISNESFTKIKIDDCLIASNERKKCDFGFLRHTNEDFYFVELKGKDIETAFEQIISTSTFFEQNLIKIPNTKKFFFIISSSGIPKAQVRINNLKQRFARDKCGVSLQITNNQISFKPNS
jgi:hypothetical protein